MRRRLLALLLLVLALGPGGCATWPLFITINADGETNQGRDVQVIVRSVPLEKYRTEPYSQLAQLVLLPDKSVLRVLTIEPGSKRRMLVSAPDSAPLALYFFYSTPTASWRMLLPQPLPYAVWVPLGRGGIKSNEVRECRLGR